MRLRDAHALALADAVGNGRLPEPFDGFPTFDPVARARAQQSRLVTERRRRQQRSRLKRLAFSGLESSDEEEVHEADVEEVDGLEPVLVLGELGEMVVAEEERKKQKQKKKKVLPRRRRRVEKEEERYEPRVLPFWRQLIHVVSRRVMPNEVAPPPQVRDVEVQVGVAKEEVPPLDLPKNCCCDRIGELLATAPWEKEVEEVEEEEEEEEEEVEEEEDHVAEAAAAYEAARVQAMEHELRLEVQSLQVECSGLRARLASSEHVRSGLEKMLVASLAEVQRGKQEQDTHEEEVNVLEEQNRMMQSVIDSLRQQLEEMAQQKHKEEQTREAIHDAELDAFATFQTRLTTDPLGRYEEDDFLGYLERFQDRAQVLASTHRHHRRVS